MPAISAWYGVNPSCNASGADGWSSDATGGAYGGGGERQPEKRRLEEMKRLGFVLCCALIRGEKKRKTKLFTVPRELSWGSVTQ